MKEQPEKFYLLSDEPECTNVCFWYVPERFRPRNFPQAYTSDWQRELGKVLVWIHWHFVKGNWIVFNEIGNCQDKVPYDDWGYNYDQLPTSWRVSKLFPQHHFKPSLPGGRHWLYACWARPSWAWPLSQCWIKHE